MKGASQVGVADVHVLSSAATVSVDIYYCSQWTNIPLSVISLLAFVDAA